MNARALVCMVLGIAFGALTNAYAEQPPPPCHPNPNAAADRDAVAARGDIEKLPQPLKDRLIQLADRPHTYLPLQVFSEADHPSQLFQYYLLDTESFEPNVFTTIFPGVNDQAQLLPGTLDLLILRAVSLGPLHGYGILLRIGQISGNALLIEQGALYPGLFRLVRQGLLKTNWGTSENNRRAKFYTLTDAGRRRLREETDNWTRLANAIGAALSAQPEET